MNNPIKSERIAKRLSRIGICSRREAERMIDAGRIRVNGRMISTPAVLINHTDILAVDGRIVGSASPTRLWCYNKSRGILCTNSDQFNRPTIFEKLPTDLPRVMLVGRLDFNSEGLILLTNNGELARKMEIPSTGWIRRYRVRVFGKPKMDDLSSLQDGLTVKGIHYGRIEAHLDRQLKRNSWLTVSLREGKNREVRKVMEHIGLKVNRLIRTSFGPFKLGRLKYGDVVERPVTNFFENTKRENTNLNSTDH